MVSGPKGRIRFAPATLALLLVAFTSTKADADDSRTLVTAFNALGHDLLSQFVAAPGNIAFAPYSIGSATALALRGANGDTSAELALVLHLQLDRARMDGANSAVLATLKSYGTQVSKGCPKGMSLIADRCESSKPKLADAQIWLALKVTVAR